MPQRLDSSSTVSACLRSGTGKESPPQPEKAALLQLIEDFLDTESLQFNDRSGVPAAEVCCSILVLRSGYGKAIRNGSSAYPPAFVIPNC